MPSCLQYNQNKINIFLQKVGNFKSKYFCYQTKLHINNFQKSPKAKILKVETKEFKAERIQESRLTNSFPKSIAASLKTFLWPGLLPQKTQILLNLLLLLLSIENLSTPFEFWFNLPKKELPFIFFSTLSHLLQNLSVRPLYV